MVSAGLSHMGCSLGIIGCTLTTNEHLSFGILPRFTLWFLLLCVPREDNFK